MRPLWGSAKQVGATPSSPLLLILTRSSSTVCWKWCWMNYETYLWLHKQCYLVCLSYQHCSLPLSLCSQKPKSPMSLLAMAVGIKQKKNVDEIVKKVYMERKTSLIAKRLLYNPWSYINLFFFLYDLQFPLSDFMIMLFHYDGLVDEWKDLKWSSSAIHVSAPHQTKWYRLQTNVLPIH